MNIGVPFFNRTNDEKTLNIIGKAPHFVTENFHSHEVSFDELMNILDRMKYEWKHFIFAKVMTFAVHMRDAPFFHVAFHILIENGINR